MITTAWEPGLICPDCDLEIPLGSDMLYGRHPACARERARARTETSPGAMDAARAALAAGGRLSLPQAHLRSLATMACDHPVRRPDAGKGGPWYGRLAGWKAERVRAGLSLPEICGMWLDYLDVGRVPPLSKEGLSTVLQSCATEGANAEGGHDG